MRPDMPDEGSVGPDEGPGHTLSAGLTSKRKKANVS